MHTYYFQLLIYLPPLYLIYKLSKSLFNLYRNVQLAKASKLSYVIVPVDDIYLFAAIFIYSTQSIINYIPQWIQNKILRWPYIRVNWRYKARFEQHKRLGGAFLIVSPAAIKANVADKDCCKEVLSSRHGIGKYLIKINGRDGLEIYGTNIFTVEGQHWRRFRRITAATFNEANHKLVWHEALHQASRMLIEWTTSSPSTVAHPSPSGKSNWAVRNMLYDGKALALNVLSHAAFGIPLYYPGNTAHDPELQEKDFIQKRGRDSYFSTEVIPEGHSFTWGKAMSEVTSDFTLTVATLCVLPPWFENFGPVAIRKIWKAYHEGREYIDRLIKREADLIASAKKSGVGVSNVNLISSLIKAEQEESRDALSMRPEELTGNAFMYILAGHETTAVALHLTLILLAVHTDVQEWLIERLDEELEGQDEDPQKWDYSVYQKLASVQCVMNESLRFATPEPNVFRISEQPVPIKLNGETYVIPPKTHLTPNFVGVHFNPEYWGEDAEVFRPSRWYIPKDIPIIADDPTLSPTFRSSATADLGASDGPALSSGGVRKPSPGTFFVFSDGQRPCLGRKFAEVELVAILAALFRKHRIELALNPGVKMEDEKRRVERVYLNADFKIATIITERIKVHWIPR
ncbi:putative P450 monooxygenase [Rhizina undulata]